MHFRNLWEHLLVGSLLAKSLLCYYACRTVSLEHGAQPLGNRSDCNNHPFIATLFCDLAIIYLMFRKFASSLWYIPLPQPVWTDMQQGTIISLVRWQLFRERSAFFCRSQAEYKLTVLQKKKSKCHLGVHKLEQSLQGTWSNASILHSTDKAAAAVASPIAFGLGHGISRKRQISWKVPKESSEKDRRPWK